jgi:hypothetical protein
MGADQRFVAEDKRDSYSTAALQEKMVKFFIVERKRNFLLKVICVEEFPN